MSTVTREFTKEQLIERANHLLCVGKAFLAEHPEYDGMAKDVELFGIALASLEAEPVAWTTGDYSQNVNPSMKDGKDGEAPCIITRYWDKKSFSNHAKDEEQSKVWLKEAIKNTGARPLYTAPPNPWMSRDEFCHAIISASSYDACRAAMPQGADQPQSAQQNIPENIPVNTPCKEAPEHIWLQTAGVWPENGEFSELTWCRDNQHEDDTLYVRADVVAGNSPVIPDGWVMVPVEPTEAMNKAGWAAMNEHDAINPTYRAMLAAAPTHTCTNDGWVACSERIPDEGQEVIVMDADGGKVQSGMLYKNWCFVDFNEEYYEVKNPSHWMPLPAAPKQEESK